MSIVIYGDFNCPFSYLASRRADLLAQHGTRIEWRAVEHAPELPLTGRPLGEADAQSLREEWEMIDGLLLPGETLPHKLPPSMVSTQAAVAGYAEAAGAGVAGIARDLLFTAYWVDGQDIGHPEVLRSLLYAPIRLGTSTSHPLHDFGYAVTPARGPITSQAYHSIRAWRADWQAIGDPTIPAIQDDGVTLTGIPALKYLADLVAEYADEHHQLLEPPEPYRIEREDWTLPASSGRFWY